MGLREGCQKADPNPDRYIYRFFADKTTEASASSPGGHEQNPNETMTSTVQGSIILVRIGNIDRGDLSRGLFQESGQVKGYDRRAGLYPAAAWL